MSTTDGRDTRWAEHRETRRRELVEDTLRAIRKHGAGVGMDEIAAQAATSKTVIYRHFGDRAGLYAAVLDSVHSFIHRGLATALQLTDPEDLSVLAHDLADAYLALVERDPEIYRFVLTPPSPDASIDPYGGLPEIMGDHVGEAIAEHLVRHGQDPACAATWGYGLVGFIRAAADRWMAGEPREPREVVLAHLDAFFTPALASGLAAVPQLSVPRLQEQQ
ncbi:MAG TPA: TetR/AcrR family transcriptional regulator [Propionicimonas sp.]|nr:TetR/AcrR family transcriptional regulator [Propionicimonas sp.]HRA05957.1 TetR/AcrR family transcriptional regulator [Propionicimonas sp.]